MRRRRTCQDCAICPRDCLHVCSLDRMPWHALPRNGRCTEMACPCFEPQSLLPWGQWPGKYRPPLGRPHAGICRAAPHEPYDPKGELLILGCNLGYARARCDRVPKDGPEAVRFALAPSGHVRWVWERDHLPVDHGTVRRGDLSGRGRVLDRQLEAFIASCEGSRRGARSE